MDLAFFWDNRDFPLNPSSGHSIRIKGSRDFGVLESDNSWTVVQAEIDKYFNLGTSDRIRQNVLAFDIWTAYTPSWDVAPNGDIDNRPPPTPGRPWAAYGASEPIQPSVSVTRRRSTTASNTVSFQTGIRSTNGPRCKSILAFSGCNSWLLARPAASHRVGI